MRPLEYHSAFSHGHRLQSEPFRYRAKFGLSALLLLPIFFLIGIGYWAFTVPMNHLEHHGFFHLVLILLMVGFAVSLFGICFDAAWWFSLLAMLFYGGLYGLALFVYPLTFIFADR